MKVKKQVVKKTTKQRKPKKKFGELVDQIKLAGPWDWALVPDKEEGKSYTSDSTCSPYAIKLLSTPSDEVYAEGITHGTKTTKVKTSKVGIYKAVYDEATQNVEVWYSGWGSGESEVMSVREFKEFADCITQLRDVLNWEELD